MVEYEKDARNHEDYLGQLQFVALRSWNFRFEEMDGFVAEETNSTAAESRQFWTRDKLIARHQLPDLIQWVAFCFDSPLVSRFDDLQFVPVGFYHYPRIDPEEREAS